MTRDYQIIDADGHTIEPPDMWQRFMPKKYHDRIPRLAKDPMGGDAWEFQRGAPPMPIGLVTTPGKTYEQFHWYGSTYDTIHPGCFLGPDRIKAMDVDGVDATVLYPSQRTMKYFMNNEDDNFHQAGIEAYNNWLHDEYCATDHGRLVSLAQIANLGIEQSVSELRDAKRRGFSGVIISAWPSGAAKLSTDDDPFWEAAEDAGIPVHIHVGVQTASRKEAGSALRAANETGGKFGLPSLATMGGGIAGFSQTIADIIYSELLDRYPMLQLVGVEVGAGWVPCLLEHMDDHYWRNRHWVGSKLKMLPSEYFHRNWRITFIREPFAVANRHAIGVKNMMWSTDFPHHRCDWPYSRRIIEEMFLKVPLPEKEDIVCNNAKELYKLG
ncbi:MAG: amidohydrolase [Chloroflexi bacterium]|nr:amidohydrolase [Chloroflexota bacterium]